MTVYTDQQVEALAFTYGQVARVMDAPLSIMKQVQSDLGVVAEENGNQYGTVEVGTLVHSFFANVANMVTAPTAIAVNIAFEALLETLGDILGEMHPKQVNLFDSKANLG